MSKVNNEKKPKTKKKSKNTKKESETTDQKEEASNEKEERDNFLLFFFSFLDLTRNHSFIHDKEITEQQQQQ